MITIYYTYFHKGSGEWRQGEREFDSLTPAIRFCWKMKHRPDTFLDGWSTHSPTLNEEFGYKVNMWAINHRKEVRPK